MKEVVVLVGTGFYYRKKFKRLVLSNMTCRPFLKEPEIVFSYGKSINKCIQGYIDLGDLHTF